MSPGKFQGNAVTIFLPDESATLELGKLLGALVSDHKGPLFAMLMTGGLGSGKTTLVRGLCGALSGGDKAEVSSPSFNILNCYPTSPGVAHFDLYRLEGLPLDDELLEHLESSQGLAIVEWAEFLAEDDIPEDALIFRWVPCQQGRKVEVTATGKSAPHALKKLEKVSFE